MFCLGPGCGYNHVSSGYSPGGQQWGEDEVDGLEQGRDLVYQTFYDGDGSVKDLILICGVGVVYSYQALFATVSPCCAEENVHG